MLKKEGGKIINIASMVSWFGGQTVPAYTAAKGGVTQLTKELSNDWIARGRRQCDRAGLYGQQMNSALLDPENPRYQQIRAGAGKSLCTGDDERRVPSSSHPTPATIWGGAIILVDGGYLVK